MTTKKTTLVKATIAVSAISLLLYIACIICYYTMIKLGLPTSYGSLYNYPFLVFILGLFASHFGRLNIARKATIIALSLSLVYFAISLYNQIFAITATGNYFNNVDLILLIIVPITFLPFILLCFFTLFSKDPQNLCTKIFLWLSIAGDLLFTAFSKTVTVLSNLSLRGDISDFYKPEIDASLIIHTILNISAVLSVSLLYILLALITHKSILSSGVSPAMQTKQDEPRSPAALVLIIAGLLSLLFIPEIIEKIINYIKGLPVPVPIFQLPLNNPINFISFTVFLIFIGIILYQKGKTLPLLILGTLSAVISLLSIIKWLYLLRYWELYPQVSFFNVPKLYYFIIIIANSLALFLFSVAFTFFKKQKSILQAAAWILALFSAFPININVLHLILNKNPFLPSMLFLYVANTIILFIPLVIFALSLNKDLSHPEPSISSPVPEVTE